jgi:asparagine synthase (glutamine-hydrolysing)
VCGIAGQVVRDGGRPDRGAVERMCAAQVHRGPNSDGFHIAAGVALGVRRLAIIDVAHGDQPIANEDGTVVVVLNGEIYNFVELRRELEASGHVFATGADTEVIVHLYEDYGDRLVDRLRGMFAFALWDAKEQRLLLARDRVGKKPLYYWQGQDGTLSFASELAALLEDGRIPRRLDPQAVDAYLSLLYVPHPLCAIEGVRKLPPASTLVWRDGRIEIDRYWRLEYEPKQDAPDDELVDRIRDELREAVRIRLVSERPLGAFLSGGVDSTAVVAMMAELSPQPVKTFAIGFSSDRHNERPHARRVAELFGTDHSEYVVEADALSILPKLITHYGDPFADSSAIPSLYVSQMASREVTVALNGDGGDESFAGYNRYVSNAVAERLDRVPLVLRQALAGAATATPEPLVENGARARLRRLLASLPVPPHERYAKRMSFFAHPSPELLYTPDFRERVGPQFVPELYRELWNASSATSPVDRMLDVDVQTYLPGDLLVKMDIATMAYSLEGRSPLLDHKFMEMAARLPVRAKVRGTTTKVGLKNVLRGTVPDDLIDRPKWGFSVPLADWMRGPLKELTRDVLLDRRAESRDLFRPDVVRRLVDDHHQGRANRASELWQLVVLELWQRRFIDQEPETALLHAA